MHRNMRISLVIPCLNEEEGLRVLIPKIPSIVDETIIVDGGSIDGTVEVARRSGAKVIHAKKRGYGRAYKMGFGTATGDVIVTADGDATYPVECIQQLIDVMIERRVEFVSSCRFPLRDSESMSHRNFLGNAIISLMMSLLFNHRFTDGASGMWVFHRQALQCMKLRDDGWNLSLEIKLEATLNARVGFCEYHMPYFMRAGTSKVARPWKAGISALLFLFAKRLAMVPHC